LQEGETNAAISRLDSKIPFERRFDIFKLICPSIRPNNGTSRYFYLRKLRFGSGKGISGVITGKFARSIIEM